MIVIHFVPTSLTMVQRYAPLQRTHSKLILCSFFIRLDVHFFQTLYIYMQGFLSGGDAGVRVPLNIL